MKLQEKISTKMTWKSPEIIQYPEIYNVKRLESRIRVQLWISERHSKHSPKLFLQGVGQFFILLLFLIMQLMQELTPKYDKNVRPNRIFSKTNLPFLMEKAFRRLLRRELLFQWAHFSFLFNIISRIPWKFGFILATHSIPKITF